MLSQRRRGPRILCSAALLALFAPCTRAQLAPASRELPNWSTLRSVYDYPARQKPVVKEEPHDLSNTIATHLLLTGPDGEQVPGVFIRPKASGVYPVVLLLHGLTSKKEDMIASFAHGLLEKHIAVLALDAPHHGERWDKKEGQWNMRVIKEAVTQGNREYRSALNYLATRKDVDSKHIGLIGYSMGSIMGSILGGVEPRIQAFALCVGGDPFVSMAAAAAAKERAGVYAVCPSLYAGHIGARPVLMLNGKQDNIVNAAATDRLYQAIAGPKQILWFESGDMLPEDARVKAVDWVAEKLKGGS